MTGARVAWGLGLALAAVVCSACAQSRHVVPALPPDSMPSDLYHDSVMITDSLGGQWSRAVIAVLFKADASQEVRQSAIEKVSGIVVGGVALVEDGYYLVRVPHGVTLKGVDTAIRVLRGTPGVQSAIRISGLMPVRY